MDQSESSSTSKFVPEYRRTNYKNKGRFTADELRRRRDTQQVELRKAKRDEVLAKRRNVAQSTSSTLNNDSDNDEEAQADADDDFSGKNELENNEFLIQLQQELPGMIEQINSEDINAQLNATIQFRQILSREQNPPIDLAIKSGIIPRLITFMQENQPEMLQLEAAWALTNIASGTSDQTQVVVDAGAVPCFIQLLYSPSIEVKEQVIWALGNVAGDSPKYRDYVLECGAMQPILNLFELNKTSLIRTAAWTLSNLCRGRKPQPDWSIVSQALPTLSRLIYSLDTETLVDACWSISYLSEGPTSAIQAVIENRIPKRLVELLTNPSTTIQTPALRAIGNIVTGNDLQTQTVINCGVLSALSTLLYSPKDSIKKEACWTISNITAGNTNQIEAAVAASMIPPLIKLLGEGEYKVKKEACWALSNASAGGLEKPEIIRYLVEQGCIKPFCDFLDQADSKMKEVTLDALENILKVGEIEKEARGLAVNANAEYIEQAGGTDKIFMCQQDANQTIYEKAYNIIEKYFHDDDEDDVVDESMNNNMNNAQQQNNNTFSFGANAPPTQQFNFD